MQRTPALFDALVNIKRLNADSQNDIQTGIHADEFIHILESTLTAKEKSDKDRGAPILSSRGQVAQRFGGYQPSYGNVVKNTDRNRRVAKIIERIKSGDLTLLDALDECLTFKLGGHGPNSFKYMLLCKLFDLDKNVDHAVANTMVQAFIAAVAKRKNELKEILFGKIKNFIENEFLTIQPDDFWAIAENLPVDDVSESESSEASKRPELTASNQNDTNMYKAESSPINDFELSGVNIFENVVNRASMAYKTVTDVANTTYKAAEHKVKELKNNKRNDKLEEIKKHLASDKDNLSALHAILTFSGGSDGPHSRNIAFIRKLISHAGKANEFGLDEDKVIDRNTAKTLVEGFILSIDGMSLESATKKLKEKLPQITYSKLKDLVETILETKKTENKAKKERYGLAAQFKNPTGYAGLLVSTYEEARALYAAGKGSGIKALLDDVIQDLKDERITMLDAIYLCIRLPINFSAAGENSFVYRLVAGLLELDDSCAQRSFDVVVCFLNVIAAEIEVRNQDMRVLVEGWVSKFDITPALFRQYCETAQEEKTTYEESISSPTLFGWLASGVKNLRSKARNVIEIDPICTAFENDSNALAALNKILNVTIIGGNGPHSLDFRIVSKIFNLSLNLPKDDAISPANILACFKEVVGKKYLEQDVEVQKSAFVSRRNSGSY